MEYDFLQMYKEACTVHTVIPAVNEFYFVVNINSKEYKYLSTWGLYAFI